MIYVLHSFQGSSVFAGVAVHDVSSFLTTLEQQAHPEGGWGYAPGQARNWSQLASECWPCRCSATDFRRPSAKAGGFLAKWAVSDGSYRLANGRVEAIWPTSLVLFTRACLGESAEALQQTAGYLLEMRGQVPPKLESGELHDIDMQLTGWPWAEGNFSWVEPTAWACLALRYVGQGNHPRVREGTKLLLDRAMDSGGINYGNRRILGKLTEPIPGPTALLLLALQAAAGIENHPRVNAAAGYLISQSECGDLEHLCWIKLALELVSVPPRCRGGHSAD